MTSFHAAHENPNDHHAVFAEYAASQSWIAVHLGQFAAGLVVIAGIITLLRAMRPSTGPALFTRVAEGAAILTASMIAVLQGVDGFTLKHAVDSLAASPPECQRPVCGPRWWPLTGPHSAADFSGCWGPPCGGVGRRACGRTRRW